MPGTFFDPIVSALIRHLVGNTCADWLHVPQTPWDTVVKAVPHLRDYGISNTVPRTHRWNPPAATVS